MPGQSGPHLFKPVGLAVGDAFALESFCRQEAPGLPPVDQARCHSRMHLPK